MAGSEPDEITPAIQRLADGLQDDPLRIFDYVRHEIAFTPYWGSRKGAHLTLLEKEGNDFDQAALLVALLRAAGYTPAYVRGVMTIPYTSSGGNDLRSWLGEGTKPALYLVLSRSGNPAASSSDLVERIWVRVTVDGTVRNLDPAFARHETVAALDPAAVAGLSVSALSTAAGGTEDSDSIRDLNRSQFETALTSYASAFNSYVSANLPNADPIASLGGRRMIREDIPALPPSLAFSSYDVETWQSIPTTLRTTWRIQLGSIDQTFETACLNGARISITFSSGAAQLWLDDSLVETESGAGGGSVSLTLKMDHPYASSSGTYGDQQATANLTRGEPEALYYGLGTSSQADRILERKKLLQDYRASGLSDTSREVVTESLYIAGLEFVERSNLVNEAAARLTGSIPVSFHLIGRTAQSTSLKVDAFLNSQLPVRLDTGALDLPHFKTVQVFSSAMEHGVFEQTQNVAAISTVRLLTLASDAGQKVFLANSGNINSVVSKLENSYSTNAKNNFKNLANAGFDLVISREADIRQGSYTGYGYINDASFGSGFAIAGGLNGGSGSTAKQVNAGTILLTLESSATLYGGSNGIISNPLSAEPIDLATGAYTMDMEDLALGGAEPRGLHLGRHYYSQRSALDSPLGHGWTHSYDSRITTFSDAPAAFGRENAREAAAVVIATATCLQVLNSPDTAKEWMMGLLAAGWAVDGMRDNTAAVKLGPKIVEYTRLGNATWNPPRGSTTSLVKDSQTGLFRLEARFGEKLSFDASKRLAVWADVDGNELILNYKANGQLQTVVDHYNRSLTFTYDGNGRVDYVSDSTGRTVNYGYDASGDLRTVADPENQEWSYVYDSHNLTEWRNPQTELIAQNFYDSENRVYRQLSEGINEWKYFYADGQTVEEDPLHFSTTYFFDDRQRQTGVRDALGITTSRDYDGQDHIVKQRDGRGNEWEFIFDGNQNLRRAIDSLNKETVFTYDSQLRLETVTDRNNHITTFGYDSEHRLTTIQNDEGETTVREYWPSGAHDGLLWKETLPGAPAATVITYDAFGYRDVITWPDNTTVNEDHNARGDLTRREDGRNYATTFAYDKRRLLTDSWDAQNQHTHRQFHPDGNLDFETDRNGYTTSYEWTPLNKVEALVPPGLPATDSEYDARDLLRKVHAPLSRTTTYGYDAAKRRTSVLNPESEQTDQDYDASGNLDYLRNAELELTEFAFDELNRLHITTDPLLDTVERNYDDEGNLDSLENRRGYVFEFDQDGADRSTLTETPLDKRIERDYNARGLPAWVEEPSGDRTDFTVYDALGRLEEKQDAVGTTGYEYDDEGNLRFVRENGKEIQRKYNELNRITEFTDEAGQAIGYEYWPEGQLKKITYPVPLPGGGARSVSYTYEYGRLKTVTDWNNRVTTYYYDDAARLTKITRPNGTAWKADQAGNWDQADRLVEARELDGSGNMLAYLKYSYDEAGRIENRFLAPISRGPPAPSLSATYDADNQIETVSGQSATYDDDGNLTNGPLPANSAFGSFVYDTRNRLQSAGGLSYRYDAENRRVSVTDANGPTKFTHNPNASLDQALVKEAADGSKTFYVYGLGLLYEVDEQEATRTYHYDERGSTIALSNDSGAVTGRVEYAPYGEIVKREGTTTTPFLFNGRFGVQTDASGLYHMRARYYHPELRRFLNADPSGFGGGLNWHAYAAGDPINYLDPFGLGPVNQGFFAGLASGFANFGRDVYYGAGDLILDTFTGAASITSYAMGYALQAVGVPNHLVYQGQQLEAALSPYAQRGYYDPSSPTSKAVLVGSIFIAPESLAGRAENVMQPIVRGFGNIAGGATTAENALTQAQRWLGHGYNEIAPGIYRSADNTRQFRMTASDLTDLKQGPHVHFEAIGTDGRTIIENSHIGITNP